jgi:DDE superfamily endonuclease
VGATIYFADESGIRSDYHPGTTWAPQGQTPVVEATGRRFSLNMISAVSPQGEFRFMVHDGSGHRHRLPFFRQPECQYAAM